MAILLCIWNVVCDLCCCMWDYYAFNDIWKIFETIYKHGSVAGCHFDISRRRGFENSAYAWIKSFLVNVFEIVVIALTMTIAGKMIGSIDWEKPVEILRLWRMVLSPALKECLLWYF